MDARRRLILGLNRLRPALPVVVIAGLLALIPYPTCILRLALGVPCPACGLTRASLAVAHLDLAAAIRFHPLAPVLIAVTAVMVLLAFILGDVTWRRLVMIVTGAAGIALVVVWALRFVGLFGGPVAE